MPFKRRYAKLCAGKYGDMREIMNIRNITTESTYSVFSNFLQFWVVYITGNPRKIFLFVAVSSKCEYCVK